MRFLPVLLFAASLHAQEQGEDRDRQAPEPGPVPAGIVRVKRLVIVVRKGDARAALDSFLAAHEAHKRGELDAALKGYLHFLGNAARADLPPRYDATARKRLDALIGDICARYDRAAKLYARDRARGLVDLRLLATTYPYLPEGRAAMTLWHTDGLHEAIAAARAATDKQAAAGALQEAIKRYPEAQYLYEAKKLLIELGGPDLLDPEERAGPRKDDEEEADEDGGETTIESSDDG